VQSFPNGVYYQRNVNVGGLISEIKNNFWLKSNGTLVDASGTPVTPSLDPFVFYDYPPAARIMVELIPHLFYDQGDPFLVEIHASWPVLPASEPQFQLYTSTTLGPGANWMPATNAVVQTNGQYLANIVGTQGQQFFRLQQNVAGAQFMMFAAAG